MKRVLVFTGAFNPPTNAHLGLAELAFRAAGREGVVFVPSRADYIRTEQGKDMAYSDRERLALLRTLAQSRPWMRVSDWETRQQAQPRTYLTLCHLRDEGYLPSLLIGSDKLRELSTAWQFVPEIIREFGIVCLARGEDDCERIIREDPLLRTLSEGIETVETPETWRGISSSGVRSVLRQIGELEAELNRMVPEEIRPMLHT